jgi:hypothetical protein
LINQKLKVLLFSLEKGEAGSKIGVMAKIHGSELHRISIKDAVLQPEYATIRVTCALFGLSRTQIYKLLNAGSIDAIHYKETDNQKGVRLVDLASVRQHLKTFAVVPPMNNPVTNFNRSAMEAK